MNISAKSISPSITEGTTELTAMTMGATVTTGDEVKSPENTAVTTGELPEDDVCRAYVLADIRCLEARKRMVEALVPGINITRDDYDLKWRNRPHYKVEDPSLLSEEFLCKTPDRSAITAALLKGQEVPGVLKEGLSPFPVVKPKKALKKRKEAAQVA